MNLIKRVKCLIGLHEWSEATVDTTMVHREKDGKFFEHRVSTKRCKCCGKEKQIEEKFICPSRKVRRMLKRRWDEQNVKQITKYTQKSNKRQ